MRGIVAFLFALLLLSGCSGAQEIAGRPLESGTSATQAGSAGGVEPSVSADKGSISVTVVTSEQQPVVSAQVVIEDHDLTAFTDDSGQATFNDLDPGRYTILAAKPGYRSANEKGKIVEVLAAEVTQANLVMDPVEIVTAATSYMRSMAINGYMSCAFWITLIGYNNNCGRGVYTTSGQQFSNPNDKTIHPWELENDQIQTLLLELKWQPAQAALGEQLWARIMSTWTCDGPGGQTCGPYNQVEAKGGKSPLAVREDEDSNGNITRRVATYSKTYPYKMYVEVRPWCHTVTGNPPGDCTHNIMINQKYDGFATSFYGAPAPVGFSIFPPS